MSAPRTVLLIQLRRIGDVLMTTPAVRALRQAWPEARLTFLTEPPSDLVYRHSPRVDEVLVYPRGAGARAQLRFALLLRRRRFDTVLDFFSNPRSALLTAATGARLRIGFAFTGRRWAYTHPVTLPTGLTYAAADKALLLAPLGLAADSLRPEVFLAQEHEQYAARQLRELGVSDGDVLVGLCPVSRLPYKRWPARHFAQVADALVERFGAKILLLWGPGEQEQADEVRRHMRRAALPDYPVPDLLQMAALLRRCRLYVGNDNGPRHFAIAVGTPTVAVFGKPYPENWTPPADPLHRAVAHDPGCKSACTYPRCAHLNCINGVSLPGVQAEAERMLERLLAPLGPLEERHG